MFRHLLSLNESNAGIRCDSAGTIDTHAGNPPDQRMRETLERRGIRVAGAARKIVAGDFKRFDLILTMDEDNFQNVLNMAPGGDCSAEIKRFCDFVTESNAKEVPDPYYGGAQGFETVLDLLEEGCASLLEDIRGQIGQ